MREKKKMLLLSIKKTGAYTHSDIFLLYLKSPLPAFPL